MDFSSIIYYLSVYSVLLPLAAGLFLVRRLGHISLWMLLIVFLATPTQILPLQLPEGSWQKLLYNIYTAVELPLFYKVFRLGSGDKAYRKALAVPALLYLPALLGVLVAFGFESRFLNELVCLADLIYLFWCVQYMRTLANAENADEAGMEPFHTGAAFFWFFSGLLIYAPCTMIVLALDQRIEASQGTPLQGIRTIHGIFNIAMYACFAIGFVVDGKAKRTRIPDYQTMRSHG